MSIDFYRVFHICGILLLFSGLVGLLGLYASGGTPQKQVRVALSSLHGVGLLVALVSGFGMAGKLGFMAAFPGWLGVKVFIWLLLGASGVLAKRKAQLGMKLALLWVALGTTAAYLAIFKPF